LWLLKVEHVPTLSLIIVEKLRGEGFQNANECHKLIVVLKIYSPSKMLRVANNSYLGRPIIWVVITFSLIIAFEKKNKSS